LNGAAGAGKSAIMQSVAERCVLAAIAIASFFFVRADLTRNNIAPLVATLVYQFMQAIPEASDDIILTIERNPLIFGQSLESQLQQLLIEPLLRLPIHLRRLFVVFIDGLDECNDLAQQTSLLKVLGNILNGRNIPIVFLIASRREPQIEAEFCRDQVANILTTIPLDDIQASDDIRRYLNAQFKEIKATHLRKSFLAPDWPSSTVVEQIVKKSSGQFIYASVVISYISLPHAHPAIQLDIINGIRPRNPSENPFTHLDALYRYIFSQVKRLDAVRNVLAFHLIITTYLGLDRVPLSRRNLETIFQLAPGELEV
jgi:CheY-like chemotaxis protein